MARKYKLLQDYRLSRNGVIKAGTVFEWDIMTSVFYNKEVKYFFNEHTVTNMVEWFEEIKEAVTLKEIGEYEEIYPVDPALYMFRLSQPVGDEVLDRIKDAIQNALNQPEQTKRVVWDVDKQAWVPVLEYEKNHQK